MAFFENIHGIGPDNPSVLLQTMGADLQPYRGSRPLCAASWYTNPNSPAKRDMVSIRKPNLSKLWEQSIRKQGCCVLAIAKFKREGSATTQSPIAPLVSTMWKESRAIAGKDNERQLVTNPILPASPLGQSVNHGFPNCLALYSPP